MTNEMKICEVLPNANVKFVKLMGEYMVYMAWVNERITHYFVMNNGTVVDHQID